MREILKKLGKSKKWGLSKDVGSIHKREIEKEPEGEVKPEKKIEKKPIKESEEEVKPARKLPEKDEILIIPKKEGRRNCPVCGESNRNRIFESVDKTVVIQYFPPVLGRKYFCGKCGTTWREV